MKPLVARSLTVPKKGMWDRQLSKKPTPQYNYKRGPLHKRSAEPVKSSQQNGAFEQT